MHATCCAYVSLILAFSWPCCVHMHIHMHTETQTDIKSAYLCTHAHTAGGSTLASRPSFACITLAMSVVLLHRAYLASSTSFAFVCFAACVILHAPYATYYCFLPPSTSLVCRGHRELTLRAHRLATALCTWHHYDCWVLCAIIFGHWELTGHCKLTGDGTGSMHGRQIP